MSVAVIVAYARDNVDKATIGFTLANAALEQGEPVSIILASEGVRLAQRGYVVDFDNGEPFKPMQQLIDEALQKGAALNVCTPCMKKRHLQEADIIQHANVRFIGGADVIRILKQADRSIQL